MKVESGTIDDGRLTVASGFLLLLQRNNLDSFAKIMARTGGRLVRNFPGRRTVRMELPGEAGTSQGIYLKRYESGYLSLVGWWLRLLRWPGCQDEAQREWRMIQVARALGIRTAVPIAFGHEKRGGVVSRSFLITQEIAGGIEGHTYAETLPPAERRRFLLRVAALAQRLHRAGFVHKDFYLGHVLVVPGVAEPDLYLIDLQRMTRPCCFQSRWIAKDLGALAYSALKARASRTDLLRCYRDYCAPAPLGAREKALARRVLRRVARLRTRLPKHDGPHPSTPKQEPG